MINKFVGDRSCCDLAKIEVYLSAVKPSVLFDDFFRIVYLVYIATRGKKVGRNLLENWARGSPNATLRSRDALLLAAVYDHDGKHYSVLKMLKEACEKSKRREK